jgi:hypothetical protein
LLRPAFSGGFQILQSFDTSSWQARHLQQLRQQQRHWRRTGVMDSPSRPIQQEQQQAAVIPLHAQEPKEAAAEAAKLWAEGEASFWWRCCTSWTLTRR